VIEARPTRRRRRKIFGASRYGDPVPGYDDDLRLAHVLADAVERITVARFRAEDLRVETKPDLTLVSDADRDAEEMIRVQLARTRPRDAVIGEEFEPTGRSLRQWVVDPIDGTHNFVRGVPVWATLIALVDDGVPVVGLVAAPALGRRWWAGTGSGAWAGRSLTSAKQIRVSGVHRLADASLSISSTTSWDSVGRLEAVLDLARTCWRERAYGDFWSYMLLAEGALDIAAEPELGLHDMAALVPVVTEAGGRFTSLAGDDGPYGGSAVATNGILHDEVMRRLGTGGGRPEPVATWGGDDRA
jgi:histidinol-phosphatase